MIAVINIAKLTACWFQAHLPIYCDHVCSTVYINTRLLNEVTHELSCLCAVVVRLELMYSDYLAPPSV